MRDWAWRRYKQDLKVIKRLSRIVYRHHFLSDENNMYYYNPTLRNFIGSDTHLMFKTYTTSKHDTKYKTKYSPNSQTSYYRDNCNKGKRETEKIIFLKILKEYGIK